MRLVGFNFNKINVEKFKNITGKFNINTNMDISEINSLKQDVFKTKEEFIEVKFSYTLVYEPDFAKIELAGNIIFSVESKMARDILKQWKEKKISEDFRIGLFNVILRKSNLKALQLEEDMNLPIHLSLPMIRKEDIKKENDK